MHKNLLGKTIFIIAVLLVFTYGIFFGSDFERSWGAMKSSGPLAGIEQNIHRGLDLKGGTHLILQVAVNEAVVAESQRTVDVLRDDLNKRALRKLAVLRPIKVVIEVKKVVPM